MKNRIVVFVGRIKDMWKILRSKRYAILTLKNDGTLCVKTHNISTDELVNWAENLYEGSKIHAQMDAAEQEAKKILKNN